MTKTIYIHIGMEKTGTTSLQNFLYTNHNNLARNNIFYPVNPSRKYVYWHQHVSIVPSITREKISVLSEDSNYVNGEALREFLEDVEEIIEDNILLSSEFFSWIYEDLGSFRESLRNYDVKIIIYLRRQDEFYLSTRNELAKSGLPFEISVKDARNFGSADVYALVRRWSSTFGKENMIVKIYDKDKFYRSNLYSDFLNIFHIELDSSFIQPDSLNESMSLQKVLLLQRLSKYLVPYTRYEHDKRILHQEIRDFIMNSQLFHRGKVQDFFSAKDRKRIMRHFKKGNKKVAREYLHSNHSLFGDEELKVSNSHTMNDHDFHVALIRVIEDIYVLLKTTYQRFVTSLRDNNPPDQQRLNYEYEFINSKGLFDAEYYLDIYSDVREAGVDPLFHFLRYGWYEGRNPSHYFNTEKYIMNNLDKLGVNDNPLIHYYVHYNNREGRTVK